MRKLLLSGFAAMALSGGAAFAQDASPQIIRGTIDAATPARLSLTTRDGSKLTITLAQNVTVTDIIRSSLAAVKSGSYIGTAAIKQPDGQYRAIELQVFPESMRGIGKGTRPWNLTKTSTMTNGTVGAMTQTNGTVGTVSGGGDVTLSVNDGTGRKTILVPSTVPVVTYQPGNARELAPGGHVLLFATKTASGALTTSRVNIGKDGLTPPM